MYGKKKEHVYEYHRFSIHVSSCVRVSKKRTCYVLLQAPVDKLLSLYDLEL